MSVIRNWFSCISKQPNTALRRRPTKVKFDVRIADSFKTDILPSQIKDLLVYIARDGVAVTDLFRRPGNPQDMKKIIQYLKNGTPINWTDYNFYTLANVSKRFLLSIDGGLMGIEAEQKLLSTLDLPDDQFRFEAMHSVIMKLTTPVQQLLALLFGIWFRMIYHTEVNAMSVEAVAKSVTGSVFPSCTTSVEKVERASKVMEYLITGFASADLFGQELIEYFTSVTKTSISRVEKFKYEFRYTSDVPRAKSARLFVRMLLEEGKKHGFDILQHAVTKEVFEATQNIPTVDSASQDKIVAQTSEKRTQVTTDEEEEVAEDNSSITTRPPPPPTLHTSTPAAAVMSGKPSRLNLNYQNSPILMHRLNTPARMLKASPEEVGDEDLLADKEKTVDEDDPDNLLEDDDYQVDYILRTPALSQTQPGERRSGGSSTGGPTTTVRFNSVKRRQMERLQKRSDWFLSPPSGCRTSSLMQLSGDYSEDLCERNSDLDIERTLGETLNGSNAAGFPGQMESPSSDPLSRKAKHNSRELSKEEPCIQVEVRYFIVERYYGQDPRPPSSPAIQNMKEIGSY